MAKRPVFVPKLADPPYFDELIVEFEWFPGFSLQQKQRSINSLHSAAAAQYNLKPVLEISSKSPEQIGVDLSAFNLILDDPALKHPTSVEAAFQGSKVFEEGGPFKELYERSPRDAKRDPRLKESGALVAFEFGEARWPLDPRTAFYDWLYLRALRQHAELAQHLLAYRGFTDIEFNPRKSLNCQARSAALYVALRMRGILDESLKTPESYLQAVSTLDDRNLTQPRLPGL